MEKSQAVGGTRSGLLWEVERILNELKETNSLPQILLMENVPMLVSHKFVKEYKKWHQALADLGYSNFGMVLNAKHYGIAQNRQRAFLVSILGDAQYEFLQMDKRNKLKEYLDKDVSEKYFLSKKMIDCFTAEGSEKYKRYEKFESALKCTNDKGTAVSTTRAGSRATDNYVVIKNKTEKGYLLANEGDGVDSSRMQYHRGTVQKDNAQTLTTEGGNNVGVVVKDRGDYYQWHEKGYLDIDCRAYKPDGTAPTTTTTPKCKIVLGNPYHKDLLHETDLRIRKLTPNECMRLMAFENKDTEHLYNAGLSDSAIYHIAGDSICVNVLMAIFGKLLNYTSDELKEIIINYCEGLKVNGQIK